MYNPKDIFTEDGYIKYLAAIQNIDDGLFYIENHRDDLHIGALSGEQEDDWFTLYETFRKLRPLLLTGDGETD